MFMLLFLFSFTMKSKGGLMLLSSKMDKESSVSELLKKWEYI